MNSNAGNYDILGIGEIPISLWVTPPNDQINNERYKEMKNCGINTVLGFREETTDNILAALDAAQANKMKFFVNETQIKGLIEKYSEEKDPELIKRMNTLISRYSDHPAYAGQVLIDEPGKPLFDTLYDFIEGYKEVYPGKIPYVNMFPTYATGGIRTNSYVDYVTSWLDKIKMPFFSYDHYPLLESGSETNDYYYNLSIIRDKAAEKDLPFWVFIQAVQYGHTPGLPNHREPSEADIRWQVFSSLAFGAKGIQYFTYWTPNGSSESFGEALIDRQGNKTPRYEYVKKVNSDIYEIGKILLNCKTLGVMPHIKEGDFNWELNSSLESFDPVSRIEGDSVMMGCFEGTKGEKKAMIVNASCHKPASIKLHLNNVSECSVWIEGKKQNLHIKSGIIELTIKSGDGVFFEFND